MIDRQTDRLQGVAACHAFAAAATVTELTQAVEARGVADPRELRQVLDSLAGIAFDIASVALQLQFSLERWVDQGAVVIEHGPFAGCPEDAASAHCLAVVDNVVPAAWHTSNSLRQAAAAVASVATSDS